MSKPEFKEIKCPSCQWKIRTPVENSKFSLENALEIHLKLKSINKAKPAV